MGACRVGISFDWALAVHPYGSPLDSAWHLRVSCYLHQTLKLLASLNLQSATQPKLCLILAPLLATQDQLARDGRCKLRFSGLLCLLQAIAECTACSTHARQSHVHHAYTSHSHCIAREVCLPAQFIKSLSRRIAVCRCPTRPTLCRICRTW